MCLKVENDTWLDSLNYLRKLSEEFGQMTEKSYIPRVFNRAENINYIGFERYISYYGVDQVP